MAHVEIYQARFVQLLPQFHLQPKVMVGKEGYWMVLGVKVVIRVVPVVRGHEAICIHLQGRTTKSLRPKQQMSITNKQIFPGYLVDLRVQSNQVTRLIIKDS